MNMKNKITLITKISLKQYPSKKEIMELLDLFLYKNNYRKDYHLFVEDNILSILFHQSEAADEFIKHLRAQKINDQLYSKLRITISFTPFQDYSDKPTKAKRSLFSLKQHKCTLQKNNSCPLLVKKGTVLKQKYSDLSLNASEAYIDKYEKEKEEIRKNKIRWVDERNFNGFVGKASYNRGGYIHNYVVREPSVPANRFPFNLRTSKKYQWIEEKDFL